MKVLITGGAGFIGSALIRLVLSDTNWSVINVDCLTYAANPDAIGKPPAGGRYVLESVDIRDQEGVQTTIERHRPDGIIHLAAESHVDRSIDDPGAFIDTNVRGTANLLQAARRYWLSLDAERAAAFRFHHVSTDEVFGSLEMDDPAFTETSSIDPRSPYSASKAGSDHLASAWFHTYGMPVMISRASNNYGPWQFPEKLIPLIVTKALAGETLPVYGAGENVRDWLYVEDHADALLTVFRNGRPGRAYNIGGNAERRNIDVVRMICRLLDDRRPLPVGRHEDLISFVTDRPGHDFRYAMSIDRISDELGWRPRVSFEEGLALTVDWYLRNEAWWRTLSGRYTGQRLGTAATPSIQGVDA